MEPDSNEEVLERLLAEVRQLRSVLDEARFELSRYKDLNKLSLSGAIAYLVRHKLALDDVKHRLKRASRDPDAASSVLKDIEEIVDGVS